MMKRASSQNTGWIVTFLRKHMGLFILVIALSVIAYVFASALMFTSGYMISLAATLPLTALALHLPSIFVRIFGVGKPIIDYVERLESHDFVLRLTSSLRLLLFEAIGVKGGALSHPKEPFKGKKESTGVLVGYLQDDIEHIQNLFLRSIFPLISMWIVYALLVVAFGMFSLSFALLMLVLVGVAVFLLPAVSVLANKARLQRLQCEKSDIYKKVSDDVLGIRDWVLSTDRKAFIDNVQDVFVRATHIDAVLKRKSRLRNVLFDIVFCVCLVSILVWASMSFASDAPLFSSAVLEALRDMTSSEGVSNASNWIAAFVLCFFPLIEVFSTSSEDWLQFVERKGAIDNVSKIKAASGISENPNIRTDLEGAGKRFDTEGDLLHAGGSKRSAIVFKDVSFAYDRSCESALKKIDLEIPEGQHVAVLGKSGAGKSTLVNLLTDRRLDHEGDIRIFGKNLSDVDISKTVGFIGQSVHIFDTTIRENLYIGNPKATESDLIDVLQRAHLDSLVESLPKKLDTPSQEAGARFSGGEKERMALCRVFLCDADIIVLDEPFAGVDSKTESEVLSTMFEMFFDKTIVVITHHLQDIEKFDRVIFLKDGHVSMDGSPKDLAREDRGFKKLLEFDRVVLPDLSRDLSR